MHPDEILRARLSRRYCGEKFLDAGRLDERRIEPQASEIEWIRRRIGRGGGLNCLQGWLSHGYAAPFPTPSIIRAWIGSRLMRPRPTAGIQLEPLACAEASVAPAPRWSRKRGRTPHTPA